MRRPLPPRISLAAGLLILVLLLPAQPAFAFFSDVPNGHWARDAIDYVAWDNTWMQDYGTDEFRPDELETRSFLARSLVTVFAPDEPIDPTITFTDLSEDDEFYPYANVAVKLGWIAKGDGDTWKGENPIRGSNFDKAMVLAIGGLDDAIAGLENIHQMDGDVYDMGTRFPYVQLARWLDLRFDHDDEDADIQKNTKMPRDEVAHALWKAATLPSYKITDAEVFNDITLPNPGSTMKEQITQFGLDQVGYPYIWAGEWDKESPDGYCCGYQPQGGFDCSGFTWWVLRNDAGNYNAVDHRDYIGYTLPERTSSLMAKAAPKHLTYDELALGNLMFFADNGGNQWDDVTHVGIYLGKNWMVHSTGGGPQLQWVADGWYHDNFVWGRKLTTGTAPTSPDAGRGAQGTIPFAGDPTAGEYPGAP